MNTCIPTPSARRLFPALTLALSLLALPAPLSAQLFDDFNDNDDNGWTHYDPLASVFGSPKASYAVTNGAYRIKALIPPVSNAGPSRSGSVRQEAVYSDFFVRVDVLAWDDTIRQAFGILARVNTPGFTNTSGYAFTYERGSGVTPTSGDTDISRITGEAPTGFNSGPSAYHLSAGEQYRFVFKGVGFNMEGRIYQLPDTKTPVWTIMGTDSTSSYASGWVGLVVYDNNGLTNPRIMPDATFDNFFVSDVEPPVITYANTQFNDFVVNWGQEYGAFILQSTDNLTPPITWTDLGHGTLVGNQYQYCESSATGNKFFRLKRP